MERRPTTGSTTGYSSSTATVSLEKTYQIYYNIISGSVTTSHIHMIYLSQSSGAESVKFEIC